MSKDDRRLAPPANDEMPERECARMLPDAERLLVLDRAFECNPMAIMVTGRDNRIIAVNRSFTRLTGYAADEALGRQPSMLKSGLHNPEFYKAMWDTLHAIGEWSGEIWDRRKDGSHYPKWLDISVVRDGPGGPVSHYVAFFKDISANKVVEERIRLLAYHDPLTGLPNRLLLMDRLTHALASAKRRQALVAVLFIDLDHFKNVNDSLGHAVGDKLLWEIAHRLNTCVREEDTVARLGGDEFVVVLESLQDREDAEHIANKVHRAFERPIQVEGRVLHATASIGIAVHPQDGDSAETLMQNADTAMYQAKAFGRDNCQFFAPFMSDRVRERLDLENTLRHALERDEFELYYQPIVDLRTDEVVCAEALIRWRHPDQGLIPPDRFIPIAEETGCIVQIGDWVIDQACRIHAAWRARGMRPPRMAVNVSPRQFRQPGLADRIRRSLDRHGVEAAQIDIELTENALMDHPDMAARILGDLKAMGLGIVVDDFGTGYSSLAYLKTFPIDKLKIDRSFVRDLLTDNSDREITLAVIALSHNLGLKVVAEGVEHPRQLEFLKRHHCDRAQGYFYSQPVPAGEFLDFLREYRERPPA
ncbi:MAG: EAL domain-containing protein [Betaproteobacteria bacterium]|nr:EAL domain-containing protein [Betaproteobacteria bacterium]